MDDLDDLDKDGGNNNNELRLETFMGSVKDHDCNKTTLKGVRKFGHESTQKFGICFREEKRRWSQFWRFAEIFQLELS